MITANEALKIAQQYADTKGYLSVQLVQTDYDGPEVAGPSFLFGITEEEPKTGNFDLVGPPMRIVVDGMSGIVTETRIL